jgi:hypothetical protein
MWRELFGRCSGHKVKLLRGEAAVRYGLIRFVPQYTSARNRKFPNASSFVLGDCKVASTNPKTRAVRFCPFCREAEQAWHEVHPAYRIGPLAWIPTTEHA